MKLIDDEPVKKFIDEELDLNPYAETPTVDVYRRYKTWCGENRIRPLNKTWLGRQLKIMLPNVKKVRKRVNEKRIYYYIGLKLDSDGSIV